MPADPGAGRILVLALGNLLLRDDGVGLALLRELEPELAPDPRVALVDGGTQGLALLGHVEEAVALLVLDAVALGAAAGTVHVLEGADACGAPRGRTAHEGNAATLLAAARLLGRLPGRVAIVGVEPAEVRTGIGLSAPVRRAVPIAAEAARAELSELLVASEAACTS